MLGNSVSKLFSRSEKFETICSTRYRNQVLHKQSQHVFGKHYECDVEKQDDLVSLFKNVKPDIVVNCAGIIKQRGESKIPINCIQVNSILPHRLATLCEIIGARLIHISTDCVFSGRQGNYNETHVPDAEDLYGRSKLLGEVQERNTITIRTSLVGHELVSKNSLVDWFLSQEGTVDGFTNAIFSGLPTIELATIIRDYIIPNPALSGIFHVSSQPISKFDFISLVGLEYKKEISIRPNSVLKIDRSLDSSRFRKLTGYNPRPWPELVKTMWLDKYNIH